MAVDPISLAAGQAVLGAGQAVYGMVQAKNARKDINAIRAAAPSLDTPAEYYDLLKKSYDDNLLNMQYEDINRSLATSVDALSGAGGAAIVGGLNEQVRGAARQRDYLTEQQNLRQTQALQTLAGAREREIGRKETRSRQDLAFANQNLQQANQQIAAGFGSAAEGVDYGMLMSDDESPVTTKKTTKVKTPKISTKNMQLTPVEEEFDYYSYG
jgi:hypothetical protein